MRPAHGTPGARRLIGEGPAPGCYLELTTPEGPELLPLDGDRITIGRGSSNHIRLSDDDSASRAHAVVIAASAGWILRDLGSRNGSIVNGRRIDADRLLRHGDEVVIGATHMRFRVNPAAGTDDQERAATRSRSQPRRDRLRQKPASVLTPRELEVARLIADGATNAQIALQLRISDWTAQAHVSHILGKLDLRSRAQIARWAVENGFAGPG